MLALDMVAQLCEQAKEPLNCTIEQGEFYGMCMLAQESSYKHKGQKRAKGKGWSWMS